MRQTIAATQTPARSHRCRVETRGQSAWPPGARFALALLALAAPATAQLPFAPPQQVIPGLIDPAALATGDVDRDGDLDLVILASGDGLLIWLVNDGSGNFAGAQAVTLEAEGGTAVELVDLDGDGDLDLVDQEETDNEMVWWEYDTAAGFFLPGGVTLLSSELADKGLAVGDADGDGDVDLYGGDTSIAFVEADGGGAFQPGALIASGIASVLDLTLADLDRDGDPDLVASLSDLRVAWFPNDGSGLLGPQVTVATLVVPGELDAADFDRDGDLDIVVPDPSASTVTWYENTGTPTIPFWPSHTIDSTAPGVTAAVAVDLDRDGDVDTVSAWLAGDAVVWYENQGSGVLWAEHAVDELADGARTVLPLDGDGDGDLDLVALLVNSDQVLWYENLTIHRSAGAFAPHLVADAVPEAQVLPADVDGDGDLDALMASRMAAGSLHWFENDGSPAGSPWTAHLIAPASFPSIVLGDDVDGDGDLDALTISSSRELWWFENDGSPANGPWTAHLIDATPGSTRPRMVTGDVDGDGDLDALAVTFGDEILWFENDGSPANGPWTLHPIDVGTVGAPLGLTVGDVDGDGDLDALAASITTDSIFWFENDGSPTSGTWAAHLIDAGDADGPALLEVRDVDGDGDLDALTTSAFDDEINWFENDGSPAAGPWQTHLMTTANPLGPLALGDLDGDGDLDAAVATDNDRVFWLENDGTPGNGPWPDHLVDAGTADFPIGLAAADVDGDGDLDLAVTSRNDQEIHWIENRGGQFAAAAAATAPTELGGGARDDLVRSTLRHLGRPGDRDEELATVGVRLRDGTGSPLDAAQASSVLASLSVWKDADGNGAFHAGSDLELATLTDFSGILMDGRLGIEVPDGDPEARMPFGGDPLTFFLVAETTADAWAQGIDVLEVTHFPAGLSSEVSTVEDRDHDLRLAMEFAPQVIVEVAIGPIFADGFESGDLSAWSATVP